jgi:hypothetical protein
MTAEEILKKIVGKYGHADFPFNDTLKATLEAMDEYAKQEAIAFKQWCDDTEASLQYGLGFTPTVNQLYEFCKNNTPITKTKTP